MRKLEVLCSILSIPVVFDFGRACKFKGVPVHAYDAAVMLCPLTVDSSARPTAAVSVLHASDSSVF